MRTVWIKLEYSIALVEVQAVGQRVSAVAIERGSRLSGTVLVVIKSARENRGAHGKVAWRS